MRARVLDRVRVFVYACVCVCVRVCVCVCGAGRILQGGPETGYENTLYTCVLLKSPISWFWSGLVLMELTAACLHHEQLQDPAVGENREELDQRRK